MARTTNSHTSDNAAPDKNADPALAPEANQTPAAAPLEEAPEIVLEPGPGAPGASTGADVEKISVTTSGAFMLMDPFSGVTVNPEGGEPVDAPKTGFITDNLENGRLIEA